MFVAGFLLFQVDSFSVSFQHFPFQESEHGNLCYHDSSQNSTALWSLISGYSVFCSFPARLRLTVIPTESHCKCKWFMLGVTWNHRSSGDGRRSLSASSASPANGCWPHDIALLSANQELPASRIPGTPIPLQSKHILILRAPIESKRK